MVTHFGKNKISVSVSFQAAELIALFLDDYFLRFRDMSDKL